MKNYIMFRRNDYFQGEENYIYGTFENMKMVYEALRLYKKRYLKSLKSCDYHTKKLHIKLEDKMKDYDGSTSILIAITDDEGYKVSEFNICSYEKNKLLTDPMVA